MREAIHPPDKKHDITKQKKAGARSEYTSNRVYRSDAGILSERETAFRNTPCVFHTLCNRLVRRTKLFYQTKSVNVSVLTMLLTLTSPRIDTVACTSAAAENVQRTILFVSLSTLAVT